MSDNKKKNTNVYRLLRIARDVKVKDLASGLMVTPEYINAIESGKKNPSRRLRRVYANVLRVDEDVIIRFSKNTEENATFESTLLSLLEVVVK